MSSMIHGHRFPLAAIALLLSGLAACGSDPSTPDDPAEDLATIRLTIGGAAVNLTEGGGGVSVDIAQGNTPVSAAFLDAGGGTLALGVAEFELRLVSSNATALRFVRIGAFSGTLEASGVGSTVVQVSLYHLADDHAEFGPQDVTLIVQ